VSAVASAARARSNRSSVSSELFSIRNPMEYYLRAKAFPGEAARDYFRSRQD
jgi:hypothetical protein